MTAAATDLTTLLGNHHEHVLRGYDSLTGSRTTGFHQLICPALEIFWTLSRSTPDPTTSQDMTLLAPIEGNGSNGSKFAYESSRQYLVNPSTRRMEAMVANKIEWTLLSTRWRREKVHTVRHLSEERRMEAMVAHLLLVTRISAREIKSLSNGDSFVEL